jgi:micrococcal nuclease
MLLVALLTVSFSTACADTAGRVVSIADGDTLTVLDADNRQVKVRLKDIDAPERGQPFSQRSRQLLSDLCFQKRAEVRISDTDRYGRAIGDVYCAGVHVNSRLVEDGLAWVYVQYASPRSPLFGLERDARRSGRGLWSDRNPVAPWQWRRGERGGGESLVDEVRGNRNSKIYHLLGCPNYPDVSERNRVIFSSESEAVRAGYRKARNCK